MARNEDLPQSQSNKDRMRRARSWLEHSKSAGSPDDEFMFLWIAFNAAYGDELRDLEDEPPKFRRFLANIVDHDKGKRLDMVLSSRESSERIRSLLNNHFVYSEFWKSKGSWKQKFDNRNRQLLKHLGLLRNSGHVRIVLMGVFQRLYILRNQVFHGGTTFGEGRGRKQIEDGSRIMSVLVPPILDIMDTDIKKNPSSEIWGKVYYSLPSTQD